MWFKKEDTVFVRIIITEQTTLFTTIRICSFSDGMNNINEWKSFVETFTWSPSTCCYLHFNSVFLKMVFVVWLSWIHEGYVLVCLICKPKYLQCLLPIFFEPKFWTSADVWQDLQPTRPKKGFCVLFVLQSNIKGFSEIFHDIGH